MFISRLVCFYVDKRMLEKRLRATSSWSEAIFIIIISSRKFHKITQMDFTF